ncbi:Signal transduction histidine kinase [Nocardioides terrae]|uniref:histidine kinase n=1 Tax=Nocardioides terrae TaxID=574651 RepID=A0A1I1EUP4_9ACTN|nr:HAMP domain-containing sensor histidine kinase [Nocardioides terrae]SFB88643.1 Signal transduction histidine kinase [Nocardioides terrae]
MSTRPAVATAVAASPPAAARPFHDALQIIAEGLTELVGFGMAVINVRRGDDFVVVAIAGIDGARRPDGTRESMDALLGNRWPVDKLEQLLAVADDWGRFKFIPRGRISGSWSWEHEPAVVASPDAWHPNDGAVAPIYDADGVLVGSISVDSPLTGRLPDAAQRRVMDNYAAEAANVLLAALDREALARRLELTQGARQLVRTASRNVPFETLLSETGPAFLEAFDAAGMWLRIHGSEEPLIATTPWEVPTLPTPEVAAAVAAASDELWRRQQSAAVYADGRLVNSVLPPEECAAIRRLLADGGVSSVLHAPVGDDGSGLGSLILARNAGQPDWSVTELEEALEVGRDIGRVIRNRRILARAQELVRELSELDSHKSRLIATVSHELRNPLTVLQANRDVLEPEVAEPAVLARLSDVDANAQRMGRVVDNLLLLAKLADPATPHVERDVDLHSVLAQVEGAFAASMRQRRITLQLTTPEEPLTVRGAEDELRILLANVIGNGIKFSDDGGHVEVTVSTRGRAIEVVVTDHGIGIASQDQARLFSDFFRSEEPAARSRPGSGLGLAIVGRILRRHGGRAEVTSTPGQGSTFRLVLPRR